MTLLNTTTAAEYLHCSESRMLELIRSGRVRAAKPGKAYVIKAEWLDDFLEDEAERQASAARGQASGPGRRREPPDLDRYAG
jgi:excisionase family DNA binding protein